MNCDKTWTPLGMNYDAGADTWMCSCLLNIIQIHVVKLVMSRDESCAQENNTVNGIWTDVGVEGATEVLQQYLFEYSKTGVMQCIFLLNNVRNSKK